MTGVKPSSLNAETSGSIARVSNPEKLIGVAIGRSSVAMPAFTEPPPMTRTSAGLSANGRTHANA